MYNYQGNVAEATADNVFVVKDGTICTPPIMAGALGGITRAVVMRLAREQNIEVIEKDIAKPDLYASDELFLTGTGAEIIGIVDIDGKTIGNGKPGAITKLLKEKFFEYVQEKC